MWQTALLLDSYRMASEDRAEIISLSDDTMLAIVADGVGGSPGGGEAATFAVDFVRCAAQAATPEQRANASFQSFWAQTLREADEAISDDDSCGETTLVVVCATPTCIFGAGVGDSEAWWIVGDVVMPLCGDTPQKTYLGSGTAWAQWFTASTPAARTLLVASDGLFKYTDADTIVAIVSGNELLTDKVAALRDAVRSSSGTLYDDFAAVLMSYAPSLKKP